MPKVRIAVQDPDDDVSRELTAEFLADIGERYERSGTTSAPALDLSELRAPDGTWLVMYDGDDPIGCGGLRRCDDHSAEVRRVFLRPAARGRNLARTMMAELEDVARRRGYRRIRLDTGDRQPEALQLYRTGGYHEIGDYNGNPYARHWLEKDLAPRPGDVRVVARKYDGRLHWHATMPRLGEDEHGVWLGATTHTPWRRGAEPAVFFPVAHVVLIPHEGDWVAAFNAAPHRTELYIDVSDRPVWHGPDEVVSIDLDLDVVRRRDTGTVELLDEDEFDEHRVLFAYPDDVVAGARRNAEELLAAVRAHTEPFGEASRPWLERMK
ncbi:GNAT family N-acetyltransferase [Catellatospora sp. NPDC049111]|uniref:GNAT family N-acetyltransferase n=1 Tax=Catellatospora sp. NPDC049111 TaxID=3155271 RepID=UPI003407CB25